MAFKHNSKLSDNEPKWSAVDKTALPRNAFAGKGEADKKSTWSYPHHWIADGGNPDDNGIYTTGTMYLHKGGLDAEWAAAQGARSGDKAPQAIIDHLNAHRKALGLDDSRSSQDVSYDQIRDMIWSALQDAQGDNAYPQEVYPSYVIFEKDGEYFKISYSILDNDVTLGNDVIEVENTWVEARSQQTESDEGMELLMRLDNSKNPEGTAWDVTICQPGFTKNGWFIPEDTLRNAADLFNGVDVNLYEIPQGATHVPDALFDIKSLLVKNKVGWLDQVRYVAGEGLKGILHFVDSAKWLGKNMLDAVKNKADVYGLSYDCPVRAKKDVVDGKQVFKILKFLAADSVDIVSRPAAGGKFNRAVASVPAHNEEVIMKQKLLQIIQEKRPDLLKGKDITALSDQEVETLARMAIIPAPGDLTDQNNFATKDEIKVLICGMALDHRLSESDLPDLTQARIRTTFQGHAFADEDLTAAITAEKEYLAKIIDSHRSEGGGIPVSTITGGLGSFDRACMALDRYFGLTKETMTKLLGLERLDHQPVFEDIRSVQDIQDYDQIPRFHSIREAYTFFTGDAEVSGIFNRKKLPPELRAKADINSSTFSYVLGNTLGRRLVAIYQETDFKESLLISVRKPVKDFRQQEAVLVGGFPDLSTVDPESADYQEISGVTDEESTYQVGQKGNILTITRKTIVNDDMTVVQRLIAGLGRAARRTHAKYVWAFVVNNANCSDGTALFTAGHGNLGAAALTHDTALTAYKALAKMTEKDSAERIGLLDSPAVKPNLVGPVDIMETIQKIATEDFYYTGNDLTTKVPNPLIGKVNPVVVTLFTDVNDWALILPSDIIDVVEMGYLNGRQEPEMFIADSPQAEQVFLADKIRYKIRHEYAGAAIDYRSGYKAVVA